MMNGAEAHLAIAKEQINYAQFWFLQKMSPLDDIAFNHLLAGNMAGAIEIWSKQEYLSSLQNRLVCYLIEGKHEHAVKVAQRLYEKFGNDYISKVDANCTLQMTATDLLHQFVDSLGEEIGMQTMLDFTLGDDTKAYISSQTIGPLVNKISSEVDKTKKVDHKDPKARIEAARKLVANTKEAFSQLKNILPATDSQYQMIADKLGLEILQCGIDYFNNSEDDDAPHTAMKMQKYAQSVVVGNLAKQRCAENVKILQKIIDELPPKEVMAEDKAIKAELSKFVHLPDKISYAISLLNNTKPFLQAIKLRLGVTNAYYLKLSTRIVSNALHNIVEEVNAAQKGDTFEIGGKEIEIPADLLNPAQRLEKINKIKTAVREAWKATILMDDFDLESDFRPHYNENRNTLKSMCYQMGISTYVSRPTSQTAHSLPHNRTASSKSIINNDSRYENASTEKSIWEYVKSPKSSRWQAALIMNAICGLIGFLIYYNNPDTIYVDEKWTYVGWGTLIGSVAWLCILYDNENREFDGSWLGAGGCFGCLFGIGLIGFYWIYKLIRLSLDGIKKL